MPRAALLVAVLALVAGCGGGDAEPDSAQPAPAPERSIPEGSERVIRAWLASVRDGDFEKAGSYFAIPSRVQNGGPPRTLDDPALAIAWNATLPCGAKLIAVKPDTKGFVVAEFELTDRKGSSCGSGLGAPAASRIRVQGGRITDWIRLDQAPRGPSLET